MRGVYRVQESLQGSGEFTGFRGVYRVQGRRFYRVQESFKVQKRSLLG